MERCVFGVSRRCHHATPTVTGWIGAGATGRTGRTGRMISSFGPNAFGFPVRHHEDLIDRFERAWSMRDHDNDPAPRPHAFDGTRQRLFAGLHQG